MTRHTDLRSLNIGRFFYFILILALLAPLAPAASAPVAAAARIQPLLLAMAAEQPDETLQVIVQQRSASNALRKLVTRLGGQVTRDLPIIDAFAAELPASAIPALGQARDLRWVSLDAPVNLALLSEPPPATSGLALWSESATPLFSRWQEGAFGAAEAAAPLNERWRVVAGASAPSRHESIVLGVDQNNVISGQMWQGVWRALPFNPLATISASYYWAFDVAYEQNSGHALIVWNNGRSDDRGLSFRTWNGRTWSPASTIATPLPGEPRHLRLAANPTSDEMVLVVNNSNGADFALVWDGFAWGEAIVLDAASGGDTDIFVAYEHLSGQALVAFGKADSPNAFFRTWDGSAWSAEAAIAAPAGETLRPRWITLAADSNSDRLALGVITAGNGSAAHAWLAAWNGDAWQGAISATTNLPSNVNYSGLALAFEAFSGHALAAYVQNDDAEYVAFRTWLPDSGWSARQTGPFIDAKPRVLTLDPDPYSDRIMLASNDKDKDLNLALWNGAAWGEPRQLEDDTQEEKNQPFRFLWHNVAAPPNPVFVTWTPELGTVGPDFQTRAEDFKDHPIAAGNTIWFNSIVKASGQDDAAATLHFFDGAVHFSAGDSDFDLEIPDATVIFSPTATLAETHFDAEAQAWVTTVPASLYGKEIFLAGLALPVAAGLPGAIKDVTWSGRFTSDRPDDLDVKWQWAAAVYSDFAEDYNALGVKPVKADFDNPYRNNDKAGAPEHFKSFLRPGGRGNGGDNFTGDLSSGQDVYFSFADTANLIDHLGPDGLFGSAAAIEVSLAGFEAEITPGHAIGQVELLLQAFIEAPSDEDIKFKVHVNGQEVGEAAHEGRIFDSVVGADNAGLVVVDLSDTHDWRWGDFDDLELLIEQKQKPDQVIHYDAIGLQVTATPGDDFSGGAAPTDLPRQSIDTSNLINAFNQAVRATEVWNDAPYQQGQGLTVAVIDSGIGKNKDIDKRNIKSVNFNQDYHDSQDKYGHGTFVAGVIAGDGKHSHGQRMGVAPKTNLISLRVSNDEGMSLESDVVEAMQWVLEHQAQYNIRVVNMSLNSSVLQSYHTSPLSLAAEMLWFKGVVVVVSAGNNGTPELYPPANDPYVITVGAVDDQGTVDLADDVVASFSAYGVTPEGHAKPDLVAPGKDIIAYVPKNGKLKIGWEHPAHQVDNDYFRMSGTSMATPMVAGAAVLLLQNEPDLTPNQVKYRLMEMANRNWPGYDPERAGYGYLDVYAAVHGGTDKPANTEAMPHLVLAKMALMAYWAGDNGGDTIDWDAVNWDSVNWDSVNWDSVNWDSVNWDSVNWDSVNWDSVNWDSVNWDSVNWDSVNWDSVNWDSVNWDSVNWDSVNWDSDYWDDF